MIFELFSRCISEKEISHREGHLGIGTLIRQKSIDRMDSLISIDLNMLDTVLKLISLAKEQVHISCSTEKAIAPLLSLYICGGRILGFEYTVQGIRIIELMAIQDVKELLMKYASVLPVFDRRLDRVEVLQMNHEEAFRSIMSNGKKENRMLSIQFIVDGHIGPYMSLTDNKTHLEGMVLDEKVIRTRGSSFSLLQIVNRRIVQLFEKTLTHAMENQESLFE